MAEENGQRGCRARSDDEPFRGPGAKEARIRYLDGDFQVTSPGSFVRCAVTGESIPLDELRYWSVARQEPYLNAAISLKREIETDPALRRA